ncbi:MAG: HD-GYP domain-containing protein [Phycisphaerae bacterium]|nr:HD-GYP domain-containing protein [Phycisphaerae bacterium]
MPEETHARQPRPDAPSDRATGSPSRVESLANHLQEAIDRLEAERDGMAAELLRAYEHLGILFEVTRRLPGARTEEEVVGLFLQSLQQSYPDSTVWLVPGPRQNNENPVGIRTFIPCAQDPLIDEAVARCVSERRAVVMQETNPDREPWDADHVVRQVLAAPVCDEQEPFCWSIVLSQGAAGCASHVLEAGDMQLLESLCVFCADLIRNLRLVQAVQSMSIDVVRVLVSTIDQKDEYTAGHSNRVGFYALLLGRALGFAEDNLQTLEWAALLHDVGKIGIRDDVLKKAGKLTPEEFRHIQSHPDRSAEIIGRVPQLSEVVAGVRHHHEHYDGSGYPDGLRGEQIPLLARVIQIADVFDALTTTRSYRKAFEWSKALDILHEESGTTVDPKLATVFDQIIRDWIGREPGALLAMQKQTSGLNTPPQTPIPPVSSTIGPRQGAAT